MKFEMLFSPIKVGNLELRNRIVFPPMENSLGTGDGYATERMRDYYVARAKGGAGLIITQFAQVHRTTKGINTLRGLLIDDDKFIPGLRMITDAVHEHGAKIAVQLQHSPGWYGSMRDRDKPHSWTSRAVMAVTYEDIEMLTEAHVAAVVRAREAGFDAIEFHGAHMHLLASFLSPYWNERTDEFGGSLEKRARFPLEVLRRAKKRVGEDYPMFYRINAMEEIDGGLTLEQSIANAKLLEQAGVDLIDISVGSNSRLYSYLAPMDVSPGWLTRYAAQIKRAVNVPTIAVSRITTPALAERVLRAGESDLVAIGRSLIADPELPNKALRGEIGDIVHCISCNEGCTRRISHPDGITCLVNTEVGQEGNPIRPSPTRKKVVVAGGGPAGLEAARVAALRGHDVTLYEAADKLGGQFNLASVPPKKQSYHYVVHNLAQEARRAGATVITRTLVTPDLVRQEAPDVVIVATGSKPLIPSVANTGARNVAVANDVLAQRVAVGSAVLVLGAGLVGLETADYLAKEGKQVTIVEPLYSARDRILPEATQATYLFDRLERAGIEVILCGHIREITSDGVVLDHEDEEKLLTAVPFIDQMEWRGFHLYRRTAQVRLSGFDSIVLALGSTSENSLATQINDLAPIVHVIGDATTPGRALDAILAGNEVGRKI